MKLKKLITTKGVLFLVIFSALVFAGDRINFSKLVGADNQFFTLFQFFGPVAGAFLGPIVGVLSVLVAEIASKIYTNAAWNYITFLRLLPMLFAAWYFGTKKDKLSFLIPIAAIILFVAHPVGRQVWYFSLFWTIPIILKFTAEQYSRYSVTGVTAVMGFIMFLLNPALRTAFPIIGFAAILMLTFKFSNISSKSLGATFTAHAVGGAMWNYVVPMTPAAWTALIPIVVFERILFASGIAASFVSINALLSLLDSLLAKSKFKFIAEFINIDRRYTFPASSAAK